MKNMKAEKLVCVHDSAKELYDKIYAIYKFCGGTSSVVELILVIFMLGYPILNLIFIVFEVENGFLFWTSLILFVIILLVYYKILDNKISKGYIQKFNLKPDNYNLFCNFVSECILRGVRLFEIESVIDFFDIDSDLKERVNIFIPLGMSILAEIMKNYIKLDAIKADKTFSICCLAISIYMVVKFMLIDRRKMCDLEFKKCLIYAKIALRKNEN